MTNPYILACDMSLTSTGLCLLWSDGTHKQCAIKTEAKDWQPGIGRFDRYSHVVQGVIEFVPANIAEFKAVFIEGYSGGVKGAAQIQLPELGGLLRHRLRSVFNVPIYEVPPMTLKKATTGKGNADKTAMAMAVYKRWAF